MHSKRVRRITKLRVACVGVCWGMARMCMPSPSPFPVASSIHALSLSCSHAAAAAFRSGEPSPMRRQTATCWNRTDGRSSIHQFGKLRGSRDESQLMYPGPRVMNGLILSGEPRGKLSSHLRGPAHGRRRMFIQVLCIC